MLYILGMYGFKGGDTTKVEYPTPKPPAIIMMR